EKFKKKYPRHPLNEEIRNCIIRGRFPSEQWLMDRTRVMQEMLDPMWVRSDKAQPN
ncbi:MAG: hypothetical protein FJY85_07520, partial [Deltaproteobacteria bacterium]|nr:hypothetical protein [Deltaproteobacteria bacterium]